MTQQLTLDVVANVKKETKSANGNHWPFRRVFPIQMFNAQLTKHIWADKVSNLRHMKPLSTDMAKLI